MSLEAVDAAIQLAQHEQLPKSDQPNARYDIIPSMPTPRIHASRTAAKIALTALIVLSSATGAQGAQSTSAFIRHADSICRAAGPAATRRTAELDVANQRHDSDAAARVIARGGRALRHVARQIRALSPSTAPRTAARAERYLHNLDRRARNYADAAVAVRRKDANRIDTLQGQNLSLLRSGARLAELTGFQVCGNQPLK